MKNFLLIAFTLLSFVGMTQLAVSSNMTEQELVEDVLVGQGVQVSNIQFTGATPSRGTFNSTNSNVGITEGVILSTGRIFDAIGPNNDPGGFSSNNDMGQDGDDDLELLLGLGATTLDAAVLEFDFVPIEDSIVFNYVFASEEYLEFVNDGYFDVFGFFLSGPGINGPYSNNAVNVALVPGTNTPVTIDNVNDQVNSDYYVDNGDGETWPQTVNSSIVQYDGLTIRMTAVLHVQACETYHIKLAIADVTDGIYDSAVFLEKGSFSLVEPIANAGPDRNICSGESTPIGFFPINDQTYSWSPSLGLSNDHIANPILTLDNDGNVSYQQTYELTVVKEGCSSFNETYTDEMVATVYPNPVYEVFDTATCSLDTVMIRGDVQANQVYNWLPSNDLLDGSIAEPEFYSENLSSEIEVHQLTVQFIDTISGCTGVNNADISVYPNPTFQLDSLWYICPGSDIQVEAFGLDSFLWFPNVFIDDVNIANPTLSPPGSQWYYALGIDSNGCEMLDSLELVVEGEIPTEAGDSAFICFGDSVLVGGSPSSPNGVNYLWSNSIFVNVDTLSNPIVFPDVSQYLFLDTSTDTCSGRDSVYVTVRDLPNVQLTEDFFVCLNDTAKFFASGADSLLWSFGEGFFNGVDSIHFVPDSIVRVYVLGIDSFLCENRDTSLVSIWQLPIVNAGRDTSICLNDSIELQGSGEGLPSWFIDVDTINIDSVFIHPVETLPYVLERVDANACVNSDTVNITVHPLPVINLTADTSVCYGTAFNLWASGGEDYRWSVSDTLLDSNQMVILYPISDDRFNVLVTDSNACQNQDSLDLTVLPEPLAGMDYSWLARCEGAVVSLGSNSSQSESLTWLINGIEESNSSNHETILDFGSVHQVVLVAENGICRDSISFAFDPNQLESNYEIDYTEVLTFNGDGYNDELVVQLTNEFDECTSTKVFNRWGTKVYDSSEHDWNWYGLNEYNAQEVKEGTYFFVIEVREEIIYQGYLSVFR